jgi:hypothetical protein
MPDQSQDAESRQPRDGDPEDPRPHAGLGDEDRDKRDEGVLLKLFVP